MSLLDRIKRVLVGGEIPGDEHSLVEGRLSSGSDDLLKAEGFRQITGHKIGDLSLYLHAMRHRSLLRGRPGADIDSNERLEYLGDAILGFVVAEHLYSLYPGEDEGFLTQLRAKLVNGKALHRYARAVGLHRQILVSENLQQQGGTLAVGSVMADAMEALIGAVFLDLGMDAARGFIVDTLLAALDLDELVRVEDNHKSVLLEYAQARGWPQPSYRVQSATGPSHDRSFTVEVLIGDDPLGIGEAGSKKQAEQLAAETALEALREESTQSPPDNAGDARDAGTADNARDAGTAGLFGEN